jgi:RNA polymerase sigma-70 factor, ECF subfamily
MGSGRPNSALQALLPELWAFALRLTSTPEDAEKLLDNVCQAVLAGKYAHAPYMSLRVNMMSTMLRRWQQRKARSNDCAARVASSIDADSEANRHLLQIVARLPDEQRIAIILIEAERLTPNEAAWAWGLSMAELQRRLAGAHAAVINAVENGAPPACPYRAAGRTAASNTLA